MSWPSCKITIYSERLPYPNAQSCHIFQSKEIISIRSEQKRWTAMFVIQVNEDNVKKHNRKATIPQRTLYKKIICRDSYPPPFSILTPTYCISYEETFTIFYLAISKHFMFRNIKFQCQLTFVKEIFPKCIKRKKRRKFTLL